MNKNVLLHYAKFSYFSYCNYALRLVSVIKKEKKSEISKTTGPHFNNVQKIKKNCTKKRVIIIVRKQDQLKKRIEKVVECKKASSEIKKKQQNAKNRNRLNRIEKDSHQEETHK